MQSSVTKKLALGGILCALGVILSFLYIPIGASKCFPVQHLINVIAAVLLGPAWAVACAFVTSTIRIMIGSGTPLAYPGSMCGALLAGLFFAKWKHIWAAMIGEILGTGILGSFLAYPIALLVMQKNVVFYAFLVPFFISTTGGALLGGLLLKALNHAMPLEKWQNHFH